MERWASRRPRAFGAVLFCAALVGRAALLAALSRLLAVDWRDLSFFYDGLAYMRVALTFPKVYLGATPGYPEIFHHAYTYTAWYPLYPFFIWIASFLAGDVRSAALIVSALASSASTTLFFHLARRFTRFPASAALLFICLPATWLLCGTLVFLEPLLLCLALAACCAFVEGRWARMSLYIALALLTQEIGFLIPIVFLIVKVADLCGDKRRRPTTLLLGERIFALALAAALLPWLALQYYLYRAFGDPFVAFRAHRAFWTGPAFQWPLQAIVSGLLSGEQIFQSNFWLRKAMIALSLGAYAAIWISSWRYRDREDRLLLAWLGVVLLFNLSLGGYWAYYAFPRLMLIASPAAILLAVRRLPSKWAERIPLVVLIAAPAAALLCALDLMDAVGLVLRIWPPGHFQMLHRYFALL